MKRKHLHFAPFALRLFVVAMMCLPVWGSHVSAQDSFAVFHESTGILEFIHDPSQAGRGFPLNEGNALPAWRKYRSKIKKVVFDASFANARPTSCCYWFDEAGLLESIVGIEYLNTEEVTNMTHMFSECPMLTELDVSNFNTSKVTNMRYMFEGVSATSLDVSGFDTRNVTNMEYMFDAIRVTSLDVSNFNTQNVTSMEAMFGSISYLTELDVSSFNTQNVTTMKGMFANCSGLTNLELTSFDTRNVTDMYSMFFACSSLVTLNLTSFDTRNVTDMSYMFSQCKSLKTIYATDKFVTTAVTEDKGMFSDCNSLEGAIKYDSSRTNKWYANSTDGYFTDPTPKTSGIDELNAPDNSEAEYYDLQGRRLNKAQKGLNIVKRGNEVQKIFVE